VEGWAGPGWARFLGARRDKAEAIALTRLEARPGEQSGSAGYCATLLGWLVGKVVYICRLRPGWMFAARDPR
jgi:hypothetical protein